MSGVCCIADGEVHPYGCDLETVLRGIEMAATVGLRVRFDANQARLLQQHLARTGVTAGTCRIVGGVIANE